MNDALRAHITVDDVAWWLRKASVTLRQQGADSPASNFAAFAEGVELAHKHQFLDERGNVPPEKRGGVGVE